jgi:glycosyl transferase family 4
MSGEAWNFCNDVVRRRFAAVLDRVAPDVVHFHDLVGLSVGMIDECAMRNIPTVLTLHDYWGICFYDRPRAPSEPLVHHSDRGVQYLSIRYTDRLAEAGIEPSVGNTGDSYDNALAETVIGLFKTEEMPSARALTSHGPTGSVPCCATGVSSDLARA